MMQAGRLSSRVTIQAPGTQARIEQTRARRQVGSVQYGGL